MEIAAILMDLRMPVLDGYGATEAIRALNREDAQTVPIIALSADAYAEDVEKALMVGMNAHLAKPYNTTEFFNILAKMINERNAN
jgi:CheY-like chemotaxis protein